MLGPPHTLNTKCACAYREGKWIEAHSFVERAKFHNTNGLIEQMFHERDTMRSYKVQHEKYKGFFVIPRGKYIRFFKNVQHKDALKEC